MVAEEKPLEQIRNIVQDIEDGRYGYYEDKPERKDEALKIYKHVIKILEKEMEQ